MNIFCSDKTGVFTTNSPKIDLHGLICLKKFTKRNLILYAALASRTEVPPSYPFLLPSSFFLSFF
jgi:hypothetical protein